MYQYDDYDRALVFERGAQFRDQVECFMADELCEEEFLPLAYFSAGSPMFIFFQPCNSTCALGSCPLSR